MACHHVARSYVAPRQFASLVLAVFEEKDLLTTSGGFAYFPCGSNSRSFLLVLTHLSFAHNHRSKQPASVYFFVGLLGDVIKHGASVSDCEFELRRCKQANTLCTRCPH